MEVESPPGGYKAPNRSDSISSNIHQAQQQGGSGGGAGQSGRDFLSSVSSELNGFAAQTTSMFSGLFGNSYTALQLLDKSIPRGSQLLN